MTNKESIYKIIGYQGEYTNSVKKAIKKLLKDNHPDHNGNKDIFHLIMEVKKELDTNQVSFKYRNNREKEKFDDIDYDYCKEMIHKLEVEIQRLNDIKTSYNKEINKLKKDYQREYQNNLDEMDKVINKKTDSKKLKQIKDSTIFIAIILLLTFTVAIIKNNITVFIVFGILSFIMIIIIEKYFILVHEITKKHEKKVNLYINEIKGLNELTNNIQKIKDDCLKTEREVNKLENDLRFYINLLK